MRIIPTRIHIHIGILIPLTYPSTGAVNDPLTAMIRERNAGACVAVVAQRGSNGVKRSPKQTPEASQCYLGPMSARASAREESDRPRVEPRFFTLEDVASYLSVSVPQVYAIVRSGQLPAIKIGGRGVWRVDIEQLEAYVDRLHRETREWAVKHPLNPR